MRPCQPTRTPKPKAESDPVPFALLRASLVTLPGSVESDLKALRPLIFMR